MRMDWVGFFWLAVWLAFAVACALEVGPEVVS